MGFKKLLNSDPIHHTAALTGWVNNRVHNCPTVRDTSKSTAERAKIKARRKQKHRK